MAEHAEDVRHHIRIYLRIFISLFALTIVTVGAAFIELQLALAIALGLLIACVKASLVGLFFMHLVSEKKMIYVTLMLAFAFFFVLMLIPMLMQADSYGVIIDVP